MKVIKSNITGYIVIFFLLSSIILPSFRFVGLSLYLTTIFSPILFMYIIVTKNFSVNKFIFIVSSLGLMVVVSSLYSNAIGLSTHTSRNYIESIKYLQFIPYLMSLNLIKDNNVYTKSLNFFSVFLVFVVFIQWLNLLNLKDFVVNLYLSEDSSHVDDVLSSWRLSLTGSGPNEGAAIATFFLIYNLTRFSAKFSWTHLIISGFLLFSVFLTQSRTALIGASLSIILVVLISRAGFIKKVLFLLFSSSFLILLFLSLDLEYVKVGFELAQAGDNNSVNVRLDRFNDALYYFSKSPVFGYGPAKNELSTIIDSEYVLILQRYGIIGGLLFGYLILNLLRYGFANVRHLPGKILIPYTVLTLVIMFTNNAYSGYQLMSITVFLILWISSYRKGTK